MLRLEDGQYGRCDSERACDWYPLHTRQDRGYLHLDFSNGVQGAKLALYNRSFIETVSVLDMVMVSFGQCQP